MRKGSKVEVNTRALLSDFRKEKWMTLTVLRKSRNSVKVDLPGFGGWWVGIGACRPVVRYTRFERKVRAYIERELGNGQ